MGRGRLRGRSVHRQPRRRQADFKNKLSLVATEGGWKIPDRVCFIESVEIKRAYSQDIICFPDSRERGLLAPTQRAVNEPALDTWQRDPTRIICAKPEDFISDELPKWEVLISEILQHN